ncbi:MAG TPA: methyltransferase regulatory domain-containing protein, partial [Ramlibacter sp.]|nr:methyltransferase regulatory domain-containing protein [Ramlibacter sp.]
NEDYQAEYAHDVMGRLKSRGFTYLGTSAMERNLLPVLVDDRVAKAASAAAPELAQTMVDVATNNAMRHDFFMQGTGGDPQSADYPAQARFGVIVPLSRIAEPHRTVRGEITFRNPALLSVVEALAGRAMTMAELKAALPPSAVPQLRGWLDLLIAGRKVAPFLGVERAGTIDRERLRKINRERLDWTVTSLDAKSQTPLLAAEYGNCLVAGWFESLVLWRFDKRHDTATQQELLARMHKAGMAFPGKDRKPAPDQLARFREEVEKLDATYVARMPYWGIEV